MILTVLHRASLSACVPGRVIDASLLLGAPHNDHCKPSLIFTSKGLREAAPRATSKVPGQTALCHFNSDLSKAHCSVDHYHNRTTPNTHFRFFELLPGIASNPVGCPTLSYLPISNCSLPRSFLIFSSRHWLGAYGRSNGRFLQPCLASCRITFML